jgi:hypothetical protein
VVISDCRFPNEIESIRNAGGSIVWVRRGELPDWYDTAVAANQGHNWAVQDLKMRKIHASETAWVGTEFNYCIDNNNTIDELYQQTASIISNQITLSPSNALFA